MSLCMYVRMYEQTYMPIHVRILVPTRTEVNLCFFCARCAPVTNICLFSPVPGFMGHSLNEPYPENINPGIFLCTCPSRVVSVSA